MTWWRRNRWGVILVLPALALAVIASAYRLQLFWWDYAPHQATPGLLGQPVTFREHEDSDRYPYDLDLTMTVTQVARVERPEGTIRPWTWPTPSGAGWWRVDLHMVVDPTTPLAGCQLRLVDAGGAWTSYENTFPGAQNTLPSLPCAPQGTPGPWSASPADLAEAAKEPRPASYDVPVYFLTAADFQPREVWLWFSTPRYIAVSIPTG
ncbi:MAG: hypothetical protein ACK5MP_06605 [Nostocoides sp.]